MQLEVRDIKRENLPDYLFNEEVKRPLPRQPVTRKVKREHSVNDEGEDDSKNVRVKVDEI